MIEKYEGRYLFILFLSSSTANESHLNRYDFCILLKHSNVEGAMKFTDFMNYIEPVFQ